MVSVTLEGQGQLFIIQSRPLRLSICNKYLKEVNNICDLEKRVKVNHLQSHPSP